MEKLIEKMKKELNSYVTIGSGSSRKIFSDTVYDLPRDIFVITNKWVASSGETFLLQMKQSDKVIVIGKENTVGAVDYLNGNVLPLSCKERGMMLRYPTSKRSVNLPIGDLDATGISPDVIIDEQVKDVIGFVKQLLKSLNDSSKLDHTLNNLVHPKGYVTSDWNKLGRVKIEGKGKTPMILIPSLGFSAEATYGEFMELNKAKYKMYAVTPAGYGGTPAPPMPKIGTSYGEAVWTNNTQKAILDLVNERQLQKPILVGHFINGTQVALKLAIDYPDKFGGVIIISGEPFRNGMSKAMIDKVMAPRWFKKVTPETWEKGNFDPSIYSIDNQVASMFGKIANNPELPTIIQYLCEFLATNVTSEMGDLKIPVLILEPEFTDKANEIPYAKYLLNSWSELKSKFGNNIEFITVKNTHVFIMHDNLKDLNKYIRKFLKKNGL
jgi:pimeloyl-ACP methyl ester carboxylesterase